jgi:hypothetical protein
VRLQISVRDLAAESQADRVFPQPQLVGFYHRNRIWIYRDEGHSKPWRIVFDGLSSPEIRKRSEEEAKGAALALA